MIWGQQILTALAAAAFLAGLGFVIAALKIILARRRR